MVQTVHLRTGANLDGALKREPYKLAEEDDLNSLNFGTAAPTAPGTADDDTFIVTSNGAATGVVSEVWKWDAETSNWVKLPTGTECPAPMTRAALRALRTSGGLLKDCHYVITDYNRGTVGAATILLHAVDANTLGMDANVKTVYDTLAWDGRYDIDTNRITELNDNLGNEVSGQELVDTFPWGVTTVSDNIVDEGAVFNYTAGNFIDNRIESGANVTATAGNTQRNTFRAASNTVVSAGDFLENEVHSDATVNSSTTGDVDNNVFGSLSIANISGTANVDANTVLNNSNLTVTGGNVADNYIDSDSALTVSAGSVYENRLESSAIVNLVGGANFYRNTVSNESSLTVGGHTVFESTFTRTTVNTTGSAGNGIRYSAFTRATITAQNVPLFYINSSDYSANSQVSASNAARFYSEYDTMSGYGRMLVSAGKSLTSSYNDVRDYAYIQVLNGVLTARYNSVSNVSYIQSNTTGTNTVDRNHVNSQSTVRVLGTSTGCRIYYCNVSSGSSVYHNGTSTGCYFYYCDASSSSTMYSNNSVNLRAYYNSAAGNSQYYSLNVTATHYAYYNSMQGHGYIRHANSSGGRIYAVACSGQGLLQLSGATPAGRIYYSSFHAYYYLYANNWTITRTSLHGYGRRTYNVTNPATNGTFTQNF